MATSLTETLFHQQSKSRLCEGFAECNRKQSWVKKEQGHRTDYTEDMDAHGMMASTIYSRAGVSNSRTAGRFRSSVQRSVALP